MPVRPRTSRARACSALLCSARLPSPARVSILLLRSQTMQTRVFVWPKVHTRNFWTAWRVCTLPVALRTALFVFCVGREAAALQQLPPGVHVTVPFPVRACATPARDALVCELETWPTTTFDSADGPSALRRGALCRRLTGLAAIECSTRGHFLLGMLRPGTSSLRAGQVGRQVGRRCFVPVGLVIGKRHHEALLHARLYR